MNKEIRKKRKEVERKEEIETWRQRKIITRKWRTGRGKGKKKEKGKLRGSGKKWQEDNKEGQREEGRDTWRKPGKSRGNIGTK